MLSPHQSKSKKRVKHVDADMELDLWLDYTGHRQNGTVRSKLTVSSELLPELKKRLGDQALEERYTLGSFD